MHSTTSMRPFLILWFGQFVSVIGTGTTQFALALWIWEQTGEVTPIMLTTVFFFLPRLIFSPFAGVLVDRLNRKLLMAAADSVAGLTTLALLLLLIGGNLEVWHLYGAAFLSGAFQTIQVPALQASVSLLVAKEQYSRAAGLMGLADTFGQIFAPVAAATLYGVIGLQGIFALDFITFLVAVMALLSIRIPLPEISPDENYSLMQSMSYGFRYLLAQRHLLLLVIFFLVFNFTVEAWATLLSPLILARTNGDANALGAVQIAGGLAAVVGGFMVSVLPAPRHFMRRLLLWLGVMGFVTLPISFSNGLALWMVAHIGYFVCDVFISAYYHATWQSNVPAHLQGRVFATRNMLLGISTIIMPLVLGQFADHFFEPALAVARPENALLTGLVGSGAGAGMAVMFMFSSALLVGLAVFGLLNKTLRTADAPDSSPRDELIHLWSTESDPAF